MSLFDEPEVVPATDVVVMHDDRTCPVCSPYVDTPAWERGLAKAASMDPQLSIRTEDPPKDGRRRDW